MPSPTRRPPPRFGVVATALLVLPLLLVGLAAPAAAQTPPTPPAASGKPNIVFILTDDLDAQSYTRFPNIQKLLTQQGVTLDDYFVDDSLCCPSRSSIFRGQYIHNNHVLGNMAPDGGFQKFLGLGEENSTVATWLHDAGYRTALMGKYLNGYPDGTDPTHVPPGWAEWDVPAKGNAYGEFNYTLNENGKLVPYGSDAKDYLVDVMSAKGADFIKRSAAAGQPFFLELATYAPHQPATPAPRYANAFPDAKLPRDPSFNEPDVSDKPSWLQARPVLNDQQIASLDALYRKRLQSMLAVDDLVANVVQTLQQAGQLDNTYVVFSSDNGFHLGQHRLPAGKQTVFETDIRVPLVVRGPGVPAGQTRDELAMNIDLAPTFAQWAGAKAPGFVDGRSLAPLLGDHPPTTWRHAVAVEHDVSAAGTQDPDSESAAINGAAPATASPRAHGTKRHQAAATPPGQGQGKHKGKNKRQAKKPQRSGKAVIPTYRAMRTDRYTYVEYQNGQRELYDVKADPNELQNLAAKVDPALVQRLSARLAQLMTCAGATCRTAEDASVPDVAGATVPSSPVAPSGT